MSQLEELMEVMTSPDDFLLSAIPHADKQDIDIIGSAILAFRIDNTELGASIERVAIAYLTAKYNAMEKL